VSSANGEKKQNDKLKVEVTHGFVNSVHKAVKCLDERKSSFNNRVIAKCAENAARISEYEEAEKAGQK
jgi:hypothetical protein